MELAFSIWVDNAASEPQ